MQDAVLLVIFAFEHLVMAIICRALASSRTAPDVRRWTGLGAALGSAALIPCWYLASGSSGQSGRDILRQVRESTKR